MDEILKAIQDWGGIIALVSTALLGLFHSRLARFIKEFIEAVVSSKAVLDDMEKSLMDFQKSIEDKELTKEELNNIMANLAKVTGEIRMTLKDWRDVLDSFKKPV
ncbi:MAG: hypothetical protein ACOYWZ_08775 [Bacillota bacterium]